MSLEHAILGFLSYTPFSGYDLKKTFDDTVQHFWSADQSQIYRTLNRLMQQDWVKMEVISQEKRPDRKIYAITPSGREELLRWLQSYKTLEMERSTRLIQVFFSGLLDDEQVLVHFQRYAAELRHILEVYKKIIHNDAESQEEAELIRDHFFWMLTLECGITSVKAQLVWAESVIERLINHTYTLNLSI